MIDVHRFDNGLSLVTEKINGIGSAGMTLLLPAGATAEPDGKLGMGSVVSEMIFRGAGDLDARQHADALDMLGVQRTAETSSLFMRIGATFLGNRIDQALPLILDMATRPHLNKKDLKSSVALSISEIEALDDEPQEKVMVELKKQHLGDPLGRSSLGEIADLESLKLDDVRNFVKQQFVPEGAILSVAGDIDFDRTRDLVGQLTGAMQGSATTINDQRTTAGSDSYQHIMNASAQQHIGLAYETIGESDPSCMLQKLAVAVLSGGMSGRLFTHIREERGLCYSVFASYVARRNGGTVFSYCGTTAERASQTLELLDKELRRIGDGVDADEFQRAMVGLKSRLVMQGESTSARAQAIAFDQYLFGQPRSLTERAAQIDRITLDDVNTFIAEHRPDNFTVLTVGPESFTAQSSS